MNPNIANEGNTFSSTNQPPNSTKRVPKWKTRFKKMIESDGNIDALEEQLRKGNVRAWEFVFERVIGKVKDRIQIEGVFNKKIQEFIDDKKRKDVSRDND